jgi:hypothetical protein
MRLECMYICGTGDDAPGRVAIYTDAQVAIRRMSSDEPGPGQMYVSEARKHIATVLPRAPAATVELRWCPAHKEVPGNEKADEPGAHGVGTPPLRRHKTQTRENLFKKIAPTGSAGGKSCGRRCEGKPEGERIASRSGTSSQMSGAARRCWTSSLPQMRKASTEPG